MLEIEFKNHFDYILLVCPTFSWNKTYQELVEDLYMSLYAFHLGQIISTVLGQVDHDGQHALKRLRLSVLNEMHTNSYTGPRLSGSI